MRRLIVILLVVTLLFFLAWFLSGRNKKTENIVNLDLNLKKNTDSSEEFSISDYFKKDKVEDVKQRLEGKDLIPKDDTCEIMGQEVRPGTIIFDSTCGSK